MMNSHDNQRSRFAGGFRRCVGISLCAFLLTAGYAAPSRASEDSQSLTSAAAYGMGSILGTALYAPFKITYAALGSLTGGLAWLVSGGNNEVAKGVIGPAVRGTYVITPEVLRAPDFPNSIAFVGREASQRTIAASEPQPLPSVAAAPPDDCHQVDQIATVYFATGRSDLAPNGGAALDDAISILERCPQQKIDVKGFADASGSADANVELSRQRAETVSSYLIRRGVSADRIDRQGYGAAYAAGDSHRAQDRRVAIFFRDS